MRLPSVSPCAVLLLALTLAACGENKALSVHESGAEMAGEFSDEVSSVLYIDPAGVSKELEEFKTKLRAIGPGSRDKRPLYEEYVPVIGANGVLQGITDLLPTCHGEAHDLGKVIFAETKSIDTALLVCRDGCFSGCMHGVLMEAYAGARDPADPEGHVDESIVGTLMEDMCNGKTMTDSYSPGDCAHATGHALMVLADYDVANAIGWCDDFSEEHMRYYCATGAYMEYVTERDPRDVAFNKPILYPCESHKYPAACARYKMVHVLPRLVRAKSDIPKIALSCQHLGNPYRIGCFHGLGNGFMPALSSGQVTLQDVCGSGTDEEKTACIDGAMERMAKFNRPAADRVCASATGSLERKVCTASVARGMYNMQKDLSLYLH